MQVQYRYIKIKTWDNAGPWVWGTSTRLLRLSIKKKYRATWLNRYLHWMESCVERKVAQSRKYFNLTSCACIKGNLPAEKNLRPLVFPLQAGFSRRINSHARNIKALHCGLFPSLPSSHKCISVWFPNVKITPSLMNKQQQIYSQVKSFLRQ
jgi:hypothetical protein